MTTDQYKKLFVCVIVLCFLISVFTISFSFFYTSVRGNKGVNTESARLGLALDVERITADNTLGLVPLLDNELQSAIKGSSNGSCLDSLNIGRCQIYKVELSNTGNVTSTITGTLELKPNGTSVFNNLKWAEIRNMSDTSLFGSTRLYNEKDWKNNYVMGPSSKSTFYVVVWISDTGKRQNDDDKGSFIGTIMFNTTTGVGTSSTFVG